MKDEVFQEIAQCVYKKRNIDDEMLFWIWNYISEQFVESYDDIQWESCENMLDKLNELWQYRSCETLSSEQSYLYGGIWGCLSMLSYIKQKKSQMQKKHSLAVQYEKDTKYILLSSIYKNPGLQNKNLADICRVTPARISQIVNEAIKDGLISAQEFGKEKTYFIRTLGECVYEIVQKKKDKLAINNEFLNYKMIAFSNNDIEFEQKTIGLKSVLENLSYNNKIMVAIAYAPKTKNIELTNLYGELEGDEELLCVQEVNNLQRNYKIFWELQREADMIKQLQFMN